jgi:glycosyltransferase involved in cell wall biosynthesis
VPSVTEAAVSHPAVAHVPTVRDPAPLRVTFVTSHINLRTGGGSNFSLQLIVSELARLGHQVRVICLSPDAIDPPDGTPYQVIRRPWRGSRLAQARMVRRILQQHEAETDLFHLYEAHYAFGGGMYRAMGGKVPVLVTLNNYQLFCTNLDMIDGSCHRSCTLIKRLMHAPTSSSLRRLRAVPIRLYEQLLGFRHVNYVDHFLPDSPAVQRIYAEFGFDMGKSTVVVEVVDSERIGAAGVGGAPRLLPTENDDCVWHVLFAGRLIAAKGVDILLDALPLVSVPVHLHIAGDGPERDALLARAQELGVQDRVTFHGWIANEQLWRLYREMHLFVHPGRWPEPCGRTVQEAMTIGIPIVVSNTGGPPWLVGDFGRTFEPGDRAGLARSIEMQLTRYDESLIRAREARERAAGFDYRRVIPGLVEVYQRLL